MAHLRGVRQVSRKAALGNYHSCVTQVAAREAQYATVSLERGEGGQKLPALEGSEEECNMECDNQGLDRDNQTKLHSGPLYQRTTCDEDEA